MPGAVFGGLFKGRAIQMVLYHFPGCHLSHFMVTPTPYSSTKLTGMHILKLIVVFAVFRPKQILGLTVYIKIIVPSAEF